MHHKNKQVILINYTGRRGAGPLIAYETAKALMEKGIPVIAVLSEKIENLKAWKQLPIEQLLLIPTYSSAVSFIKNHLQFVLYRKYRIRKALEAYEVRAVYCPMCTFWTGSINSLFPGAKKIVVCHDPVLHAGEKYALAVKLLGVDRVYRNADEIIVHTKKFIPFMERYYKKAGHVCYMPLGKHNFYHGTSKTRSIIEYDAEKTNYVFFGRISPYKGLDTLADAYKVVSSQCSDVSLTIVGAGDFRPYRRKYQELEYVTIINRWIADEEVESVFLGENLIVVLPYTDATQSGVAMVAMNCGVPVIAADTGGLAEQIEDGVTGLLAAANDYEHLARQMLRLKGDKDLYQKICTNMQKKPADMEWSTVVDKIIKLTDGYESTDQSRK